MKKRVPNLLVFLLIFTLFTSLFIIPLVFAESQTKWVKTGETQIQPSEVVRGWFGLKGVLGDIAYGATKVTLNVGQDSLIPILQDYVALKQKNVATDVGFLNKLKAAPETQIEIRFPTGADERLTKATKETMWSQLAEAKLGTLQKSGDTIVGFTPSTSEAGQKSAELLKSLDKAMYKSDSSGKITSSVQPGIAGLDIEKNGETATIYKIDKNTGARTPISSLSTSDPNQNQIVNSLFDFVTTQSKNPETQKKKECKLNDLLCNLPQIALNLPNLEKEAATKSENQYLDVRDAIQETIDSLPPEITPEERQAAKEKALQEEARLSGPTIEEQGASENGIFQNTVLTDAQILASLNEEAANAGDQYDKAKEEYTATLMKYSNKQDKTDADRAALEAALKKSDAASLAEIDAFNRIAQFKEDKSSPSTPTPEATTKSPIQTASTEPNDMELADQELEDNINSIPIPTQIAQTSQSSDKPWLSRAWGWLFGGSSTPTQTASTEPPAPTTSEIPSGTKYINSQEFKEKIEPLINPGATSTSSGNSYYYSNQEYGKVIAVKDKLGRYYVPSTTETTPSATDPSSTPSTPQPTQVAQISIPDVSEEDILEADRQSAAEMDKEAANEQIITNLARQLAEVQARNAQQSTSTPQPTQVAQPSSQPTTVSPPAPTLEQLRAAADAAQQKLAATEKAYSDYWAKAQADPTKSNSQLSESLWKAKVAAQAEYDSANAQIAPPPRAQPQQPTQVAQPSDSPSTNTPLAQPTPTGFTRGNIVDDISGKKRFVAEKTPGEGNTIMVDGVGTLIQIGQNGRPSQVGVIGEDGKTVNTPATSSNADTIRSQTVPITIKQGASSANLAIGYEVGVNENGEMKKYSVSDTRANTDGLYYLLKDGETGKEIAVSGRDLIKYGQANADRKYILYAPSTFGGGAKEVVNVYPSAGLIPDLQKEVPTNLKAALEESKTQKSIDTRIITSQDDLQKAIAKEGNGVLKYTYPDDPTGKTGDGSTRWYRPDGSLVAIQDKSGTMRLPVSDPVTQPLRLSTKVTTIDGKKEYEVSLLDSYGRKLGTAKVSTAKEANALWETAKAQWVDGKKIPPEFEKPAVDDTQSLISNSQKYDKLLRPGTLKIEQILDPEDSNKVTVATTEIGPNNEPYINIYYTDEDGNIRLRTGNEPKSDDPIIDSDNPLFNYIEMQMKKDNPDKLTPSETIIIQPEEDNYPLSKNPSSTSTNPNTQSQDKLFSTFAQFFADPIKALTGKSLSDLTGTPNPIAEKIPDATPSSGIPLPASAIPPPSTSEPTTTTDTSPVKQGSFAPDDNGNLKFKTSILPSAKSHYSVDSSGNIYNDKNGQNSRELIGKQNPDGSVVFYEGKNPDLTEYEYKKDKNGQYSFKNSKAKLTPIKINTIPTPTSQETQTQIPSKPETSATPSTEQPFELPPDWEELGLTEEQYRKEYGLDTNKKPQASTPTTTPTDTSKPSPPITPTPSSDLEQGYYADGEWIPNEDGNYVKDKSTGAIYNEDGNPVVQPATPTTTTPTNPLDDVTQIPPWEELGVSQAEYEESSGAPTTDKLFSTFAQFFADPIKALTGKSLSDLTRTSNPIAEKIDSQKPDDTPVTKKEVVGDSKYTLGSGTYNGKPATAYRDYETGEILGYTQNGKYYRNPSLIKEGTEYMRNPDDATVSSKDSEGNNHIYYLNPKDGKWYEQIGEGANPSEKSNDKLVDDKKLEMQLSETYSVPEGYMFIPSTTSIGQLMQEGDDCTDDSDCASNFCDKSEVVWVCGKAEFAPSPIAFGNCIPGESRDSPQTCEYCNNETSMWTDWCAEQGQICGGDSQGTCYDCVDDSGEFYYNQETEPWSCSTCNIGGSWEYYCPDNTYCSDSGNGKCYSIEGSLPADERSCDADDPENDYDPISCTSCQYDESLGVGKWIPQCDSYTQYCDGEGKCIEDNGECEPFIDTYGSCPDGTPEYTCLDYGGGVGYWSSYQCSDYGECTIDETWGLCEDFSSPAYTCDDYGGYGYWSGYLCDDSSAVCNEGDNYPEDCGDGVYEYTAWCINGQWDYSDYYADCP